jgi:mannan endo-1,4-beta-mannosidase
MTVLARRLIAIIIGLCVVALAAFAAEDVVKVRHPLGQPPQLTVSGRLSIGQFVHHHVVINLPARPTSYLGAYVKGVPYAYDPVESFAAATGVRPNISLYYSGWYEKFQSAFAVRVQQGGGIPFIQIDPSKADFGAIVAGVYDTYLEKFATQVAGYGAKTGQGVIIGFGHEMNGSWYPWGYRHVAPALFVAAWRHIVNVFREQGADDVTWLWTVNIINTRGGVPSPAAWWPGNSYVTWVGIDGYYYKPSWTFASLFGPTIRAVHSLTLDPILIAETGVAPVFNKPKKIADLFAGVRAYGLLGLVWFNAPGVQDWRLTTPAQIAAFRRGAKTFNRLTP